MSILLIVPVLLPILAGLYILKAGFQTRKSRERFVAAAVIINAVIVLALSAFARGTELTLFDLVPGNPVMFKLDTMGAMFASLVSLLWILCIFYAFEYMTHEGGENRFFAFYTMAFGVMMGISFSGSLITMYLFYELLTFITMPLVIHNESEQSKTAARVYLIFSIAGATIALMGIVMIALTAGTTAFVPGGVISGALAGASVLQIAYVLAFFGFGVKSAVMPFHAWLPVASVAPTPVSALLHAVAVVKAGVFAVARVTYFSIGPDALRGTTAQYIVLAASLVTILYGSAMALMMKHLKRRLAYSTVSQLSYILFGLALMSADGYVGGMMHLVGHAIVKITLFLCAGAILYKTHREYVWELRGIGKAMPVTMVVFTIASFALVGVPPLPGFFSKWYLTLAVFRSGSNILAFGGTIVLAVSALLTAIYLFSICVSAFMPGKDSDLAVTNKGVSDPNRYMTIPLIILAVAIIAFGALVGPISSMAII
ncbi:MAG: proton-conducting membrane transporter [Oscillospiraceae bacterium]|nr:proton-conducting membrane transporter [Oscillospiraceae bacterium]